MIEVELCCNSDQNYRNELLDMLKVLLRAQIRAGKFEAANTGTIFLDEIGDRSFCAGECYVLQKGKFLELVLIKVLGKC
jgi:transcriptional regulator of aromatic amino acid metabolism